MWFQCIVKQFNSMQSRSTILWLWCETEVLLQQSTQNRQPSTQWGVVCLSHEFLRLETSKFMRGRRQAPVLLKFKLQKSFPLGRWQSLITIYQLLVLGKFVPAFNIDWSKVSHQQRYGSNSMINWYDMTFVHSAMLKANKDKSNFNLKKFWSVFVE